MSCHHLRAHEYHASAAMTLTNPIQGIGDRCVVRIVSSGKCDHRKHLGSGETRRPIGQRKKLMLYGAIGSALLSVIVMIASKAYVGIYQVDNAVASMTMQILFAYAIVVPFKVLNILGGGIIEVVDEQNMSCSLIWSVHGVLVFLWGF